MSGMTNRGSFVPVPIVILYNYAWRLPFVACLQHPVPKFEDTSLVQLPDSVCLRSEVPQPDWAQTMQQHNQPEVPASLAV